MRGDVENLRTTLGQLVQEFGDKLLITSDELIDFVAHRNLIAHNYWRLTGAKIPGGARLDDPQRFLEEFATQCSYWESVLRGLLALMRRETGISLGQELKLSETDAAYVVEYERHAAKHLEGKR